MGINNRSLQEKAIMLAFMSAFMFAGIQITSAAPVTPPSPIEETGKTAASETKNLAEKKVAEAKAKALAEKKAAEAKAKALAEKKAAEAKAKALAEKKAAEAKAKALAEKKAAEAQAKALAEKKAAEAKAKALAEKKAAEAKAKALAKQRAAEAKAKALAEKKAAEAKAKALAKQRAAEAKAKALAEKKAAEAKAKALAKKKAAEAALARKLEQAIKQDQKKIQFKRSHKEYSRSLSSFLSTSNSIARLSGVSDSFEAIIPVSLRIKVKAIKLRLVFSNSLSLSKERSQLRFRFNEHLIGQVSLDPDLPEGVLELSIPTELIKHGDNSLKVESTLHSPGGDDGFGSELWAEIDSSESTLSLAFSRADKIKTTFANLPTLMAGGKWSTSYPLSILMATDQPSDVMLNAASSATQGIALQTNSLPLEVHTMQAQWAREQKGRGNLARLFTPFGDVDSVLLGTYQSLEAILGKGVINTTQGDEQLLVRQHPLDPVSFVVIIAGKTEADMLSAARHFATMDLSLNNSDTIYFDAQNRQEAIAATHVEPSKSLQSMMRYSFGQLNMKEYPLKKPGDFVDLDLKLPSDFFATQENYIVLQLHMAYTPGMADGSMVNILLNGDFQRSIPLHNKNGELVENYSVKVPMRSFQPGVNTVRFEANIIPNEVALRSDLIRKMLQVQIYDDSIIRIPKMSQYALLPDLSLLKSTGYPYVEHEASTFVVATAEDTHFAAALTLIAKLAQIQDRVVNEISLSTDLAAAKGESIFLVGSLAEIDSDVWQASPFKLKNDGLLVPVINTSGYRGVPYNALSSIIGFEKIVDAFELRASTADKFQHLSLSNTLIVSQFESPWAAGKSLTLLASQNPQNLAWAAYQLVDEKIWQQLSGDTSTLRLLDSADDKQTTNMKLSSEYHTGSLSLVGKIAYYAITQPIYLIFTVIMLVLLLTWLTRRLLILRHHQKNE